jgi:type IV pilus assembly protein PilA
MVQKLRQKSQSESGFTLVELLVVMLILGLLAAIAVPSFFNQRDKARDADAKAGVRTAQTAIETYATDNGGAYTGATVAGLRAIEDTLNDVNLAPAPVVTANTYTVSATSTTGNVFNISRNGTGQVTYTCTATGVDGCPSSGNWGG